jgi:hypothetical protein
MYVYNNICSKLIAPQGNILNDLSSHAEMRKAITQILNVDYIIMYTTTCIKWKGQHYVYYMYQVERPTLCILLHVSSGKANRALFARGIRGSVAFSQVRN